MSEQVTTPYPRAPERPPSRRSDWRLRALRAERSRVPALLRIAEGHLAPGPAEAWNARRSLALDAIMEARRILVEEGTP